ncbi:MAG: hypothetical protein QXU67_05685, partial [Candidatus Bathyarchaeia archaeon]
MSCIEPFSALVDRVEKAGVFQWNHKPLRGAAEALLRRVLEACTNKPLILVDRGPWYPEALRSLGLKWRHMTFGMRNRVERWFGILK